MKRLLSLLLCVACLLSLCGCDTARYEEAATAVAQTTLTEQGTYGVTPELLTALECADYAPAKNVIFMIGDGMGFAAVEAAEMRYRDQLYQGKLNMHYLPHSGRSITFSADNAVTDSAAGGTALATGFKTSNSTVGMNVDDTAAYLTTLELAARKGKSTGVVVTKSVTDATPATFTAHVGKRTEQGRIGAQQVFAMQNGTLSLLLGGGLDYFTDAGVVTNHVTDMTAAQTAKLPVLGLFSGGAMNTADSTQPTLAQMTQLALDRLSSDKDGFFLMVEGSQIDTFAHSNKLEESLREVYAFDCAVGVAMRYVALHPDTVLIVTADHETGGLTLPSPLTPDSFEQIRYTSGSHTGQPVPVFAIGYGTEALATTQQNTDLAIFTASVLGETSFGQRDTVYTVCEESAVTFTADNNSVTWKAGSLPKETVPCALYLQVTNTGSTAMKAPTVLVDVGGFGVLPDVPSVTLQPGQITELIYVLSAEHRPDAAAGGDVTLMLFPKEGPVSLQVHKAQYLCRPEGR